jgi:hypothetical protein
MTDESVDRIVGMIQAAKKDWTECDWYHHRRTVDEYGVPTSVECSGGNGICPYCRSVVESAKRAHGHADRAIALINDLEYEAALEACGDAAWVEREWGDDTVWGPVVDAFTNALAEECED